MRAQPQPGHIAEEPPQSQRQHTRRLAKARLHIASVRSSYCTRRSQIDARNQDFIVVSCWEIHRSHHMYGVSSSGVHIVRACRIELGCMLLFVAFCGALVRFLVFVLPLFRLRHRCRRFRDVARLNLNSRHRFHLFQNVEKLDLQQESPGRHTRNSRSFQAGARYLHVLKVFSGVEVLHVAHRHVEAVVGSIVFEVVVVWKGILGKKRTT